MSFQRLIEYLEANHAKYTLEIHSPAYTTQEVAERAHVRGHKMGKVVVLEVDGALALCLLPSHYHVNCDALTEEVEAKHVRVVQESEFANRFPQCETGAIPPFSALWDIPVLMSFAFDTEKDIYFNAGNWSEILRMPCSEYVRLEHPKLISKGAQAPGMTPPKVSIRRGREALRSH